MADMQNEINQFYNGLALVKGWHSPTYEGLYKKVISNMKLNHKGVQYGTIKAIREAENNWGILGTAGEVAAMVAVEGGMPQSVGAGPKGVNSSARYYDEMLAKKFTLDDLNSFRGANSSSVANWLEENGWTGVATNPNRVYSDGMRYTNGNRGEQIRIMSGGPTRSIPEKRGPYMEASLKGKKTVIPLSGNKALY
ncbi:hypothetical protein [Chryseobacterium takakiae]|uniref:Uncharacterized protein n=1 Tax=Chryseobacterium takakiae TaxID=1302685 RepID=A0A1M4UH35_9FLAO|nr:hypothetical protein [Chryseobacterium takakiae]SHE56046.1 hypothetical protein SAMN05444408_102105 [Chryseobacterium takakiae]